MGFILNPPLPFLALWKIVGAFVDPITKRKIHFLKNKKSFGTILHYVAPEQLEQPYGGTQDFVYSAEYFRQTFFPWARETPFKRKDYQKRNKIFSLLNLSPSPICIGPFHISVKFFNFQLNSWCLDRISWIKGGRWFEKRKSFLVGPCNILGFKGVSRCLRRRPYKDPSQWHFALLEFSMLLRCKRDV